MIVCITGATGFIGGLLAKRHIGLGHEVRYLTRSATQHIAGAKAFVADLNAPKSQLTSFLLNADVVYHCAGEISNEKLMYATHVNGTKNVLQSLNDSRTERKLFHWVQLSSCGAYGQEKTGAKVERYVNEEVVENPKGEYELTKTEADSLITGFATKHDWFKYTIIRPTIVFGPSMRSHAIVRLCKLVQKKLFFYVGNKDALVNYVSVGDVVNVMVQSANNIKAYNETFIVSNDCKFKDAIDTMADVLKTTRPNWVVNEFLLRKFVQTVGKLVRLPISNTQIDVMVRQTHYSNARLKKQLGWVPGPILVQLAKYVETEF